MTVRTLAHCNVTGVMMVVMVAMITMLTMAMMVVSSVRLSIHSHLTLLQEYMATKFKTRCALQ